MAKKPVKVMNTQLEHPYVLRRKEEFQSMEVAKLLKVELTISSYDLLKEIINPIRLEAGEPAIENSKFLTMIEDELEGELTCRQFFVMSYDRGSSRVEYYNLAPKQALRVSLRCSKAVRKIVPDVVEALVMEVEREKTKNLELRVQIKDYTKEMNASLDYTKYESTGEAPEGSEYAAEADMINRIASGGLRSKQWKAKVGCPANKPLRDYLPPEKLHHIAYLQQANWMLIESKRYTFQEREQMLKEQFKTFISRRALLGVTL